jgi:hypothetical protein
LAKRDFKINLKINIGKYLYKIRLNGRMDVRIELRHTASQPDRDMFVFHNQLFRSGDPKI